MDGLIFYLSHAKANARLSAPGVLLRELLHWFFLQTQTQFIPVSSTGTIASCNIAMLLAPEVHIKQPHLWGALLTKDANFAPDDGRGWGLYREISFNFFPAGIEGELIPVPFWARNVEVSPGWEQSLHSQPDPSTNTNKLRSKSLETCFPVFYLGFHCF